MTSIAINRRQIELNRQERNEGLATPLDIKRGEVVEVDGSIEGDLSYLVWVKPFETNATPMQMFNPGSIQNLQTGMPVFYKRSPEPPGLWTIDSFDSATWASSAATFLSLPGVNSPPHAAKHTMPPGGPGPDPLNVFSHAMVDFAVRPTQPPSMKVRISSGWYPSTTAYAKFSGPENSKDFTSDIPAGAGNSIIIAIAIDKAGAVTYVDGVAYVTGEPVPDASLPVVSTDLLLITAVRLDNGMAAIQNEHFDHEMRPIFAPGGLARAHIQWKLNTPDDFLLTKGGEGIYIGLDDISYDAGATGGAEFLQVAAEADEAGFGMYNFTNTNEPRLQLYRATGIDHANPAAVADTNSLGFVGFKGYGSSQFNAGAQIEALVDGTPSGNDVPVALAFSTHELTDGADTVVKRMWLNPAGRLGIGIAAPLAKLHVFGTADEVQGVAQAVVGQTTNIWEWQDSGGNALSGIDERGIPFADGGSPASNSWFGPGAGNPAASGTNNAGFGLNALGVLTSGNSNFAGGAASLAALLTGSRNFGLGTSSLSSLTAGNNNIGIGQQAFRDLINKSDNIGIGRFVGRLIDGSRNIIIGTNAGATLLTGDDLLIIANTDTTTPLISGLFTGTEAGLTIHSQATDGVPLIAKGITSQASSLFETQDSGGVVQTLLAFDGAAEFNVAGNVAADFRINSAALPDAFFLDGGTNDIGMGTDTPAFELEVLRSGTASVIGITSYGSSTRVQGRSSNGTEAFPTASVDDNLLFSFRGFAHDGTSFFRAADVEIRVDGTPVGDDIPGAVRIVTHALGMAAGTVAERVRVIPTGEVGIGTAIPATRLDIDAGAMTFAEMTAPGGGAANSATLYAVDNGAGKTQLAVVFNTGAVQILATQP